MFLITALGFVLYGSLVLLPLLLQTLLGYSALQAGMAIAPRGLGSFLAMPIIGMIVGRFARGKLLAGGLIGVAVTLFWFAPAEPRGRILGLFWPQIVQGVALGLIFVPLTTVRWTRSPTSRWATPPRCST